MTDQPIEQTPEPDVDDSTLDDRTRDALKKLRQENHSLRTRLRDSEEQVGIASARLTAHHRAVIEAAAKAAGLLDPSDFTAHHPDPNEFVDEFADVVPDRVTEAARALLEAKPHLAAPPAGRPPTDRPLKSLRGGATPEDKPKPAPSWSSVIRRA